jgi:hypothetical protein
MAITDPEELARKQVELMAFSDRMSDPEAYVVNHHDQCFDEDWDVDMADHYVRWSFDVKAAPDRTSILLYVPWPNGADFRGEGYHDDREGGWRWADGRAIDRPVVAWMHIPPAPRSEA